MLNKNNIKMLVLDMDGTTYHKMGEIVEENIPAILEAIDSGVKVAFATGRPALAPQNKLVEYGFTKNNSVVLALNGGCIYDLNEKKVVSHSLIDSSTVNNFMIDAAKEENSQTGVWVYTEDVNEVVTLRLDGESNCKAEKVFFEGKYIDWFDLPNGIQKPCYKLIISNITESLKAKMEALDFEVVATSDPLNFEANAKNIGKGMAVKKLAEIYNIDLKDVMAIGDSYNDFSMLNVVGWPIAMKNSCDAIKHIAKKYVDFDFKDGAVKTAIEKYILDKEVN